MNLRVTGGFLCLRFKVDVCLKEGVIARFHPDGSPLISGAGEVDGLQLVAAIEGSAADGLGDTREDHPSQVPALAKGIRPQGGQAGREGH